MQMNDRYKQMPNGTWYDAKAKKFVSESEVPKTMLEKASQGQKSADTEKKTDEPISTSFDEEKPKIGRPRTKPKDAKEDGAIAKAHTQIAREILDYNSTHELNKTDAAWLLERGFWYFDRCVELGITPVPQGLVLALGFKATEQNMLLSGNGGLPQDCKEVVLAFKQALEMVAEGTLVDSKSGQVGRIFDLKNRFGWSDQGNAVTETENRLGEIKSPEELRKALAKLPTMGDDVKIVDAQFEVVE